MSSPYRLLRMANCEIPEQAGTFGLMDRRVVDLLNAMPDRSRFFAGLRAWIGGRQEHVAYERQSRGHGRSRVGLLGLLSLAETALVSFSKLPLRATSALSLICAVGTLLVGIGAIAVRTLTQLAIPGWAHLHGADRPDRLRAVADAGPYSPVVGHEFTRRSRLDAYPIDR